MPVIIHGTSDSVPDFALHLLKAIAHLDKFLARHPAESSHSPAFPVSALVILETANCAFIPTFVSKDFPPP